MSYIYIYIYIYDISRLRVNKYYYYYNSTPVWATTGPVTGLLYLYWEVFEFVATCSPFSLSYFRVKKRYANQYSINSNIHLYVVIQYVGVVQSPELTCKASLPYISRANLRLSINLCVSTIISSREGEITHHAAVHD